MIEHDDIILYLKLQQKDKEALERLYDKYEKLLYSFSYRMVQDSHLAEEVVQEVFIKLWKGNGVYDDSKGKFSSWLLTMTRNTAIDIIRKTKKELSSEIEERDSLQSQDQSIEDQVEWKEEGSRLRKAVDLLKQEQKRMIDLFYFKGLTQQRISEECNLPLGTVKGRIRLALKHLKSQLDQEGRVPDDKTRV